MKAGLSEDAGRSRELGALGRCHAVDCVPGHPGVPQASGVFRAGRTPAFRALHPKVYHGVVARTNIDIDEELVTSAMRRYGLPSKRAAVDLALRRLVVEPMTREEVLAMEGTGWEGDLAELRRGRLFTA